jgi:hypothetical protein
MDTQGHTKHELVVHVAYDLKWHVVLRFRLSACE